MNKIAMRKIVTILSILTLITSSCRQNSTIQGKSVEKLDKYVGIYEYANSYSSEENQYIILSEEGGKIKGLYYGTSDEFDENREGYYSGFFVSPMNQLEINGDTIKFVLTIENSDYLTKPIDLKITSTQEAMKLGYENWENFFPTESKKYVGIISDMESIFFKGKIDLLDKKFVKRNFDAIQSRKIENLPTSFQIQEIQVNFSGNWSWIENNDNHTFTISLNQEGNEISGTHIAVVRGGLRIDAFLEEEEMFIVGTVSEDGIAIVEITSGYSEKVSQATIKFIDDHTIKWTVISSNDEHYFPDEALMNTTK
jgi:hypothetical protein